MSIFKIDNHVDIQIHVSYNTMFLLPFLLLLLISFSVEMPKRKQFGSTSIGSRKRKGKQRKRRELATTLEESSIDPTIDLAHDSTLSEPSPSHVSPLPATTNVTPATTNNAPPCAAAKERAKGNDVNYDEREDYGKTLFNEALRRASIACYFVEKHNMCQDETLWGGRSGIIADIKKTFNIPRGTEVTHILRAVIMYQEIGELYTGETASCKTGRIPILAVASQEAVIIANSLERGLSPKLIHLVINKHRLEQQLPSVTLSAVEGLITRMNPVKRSVGKRPQGSYDVDSRICRARYLLALQLAVRARLPCAEAAVKEYCETYNKARNLPADHVPKYLRVGDENDEKAGIDFCTPLT